MGKTNIVNYLSSFLSKYLLFHVLPFRCFITAGQNGGHIRKRSKTQVNRKNCDGTMSLINPHVFFYIS